MEKDKKKYKLLVVEDNIGDYVLIEDYLLEQILSPEITHLKSFKELEQLISNSPETYDAVFLDLSLPDKSGEELVKEIIKLISQTPIIVLTGYADMHFSIKSIAYGISDYLLKDELNAPSLYKSLLYNIERKNYIKSIEKRNTVLQEIAWIQSHEVRGPLARIMGFINLIKDNENLSVDEKNQLLNYLLISAEEFDAIVKKIISKTNQVL